MLNNSDATLSKKCPWAVGALERAVIFGDASDIVHMFIYTSTLDIDSRLAYSDFNE